jgi:hypothetical protein
MVDGGVTAYGPDGSIVGVSKDVPEENGWLSFLRTDNGTTVSPAEVYCELVGFEKPRFFVTGLDRVSFELLSSTRALMVTSIPTPWQ